MMVVSIIDSGAGSVAVSALPILPKTRLDLRELADHAIGLLQTSRVPS